MIQDVIPALQLSHSRRCSYQINVQLWYGRTR